MTAFKTIGEIAQLTYGVNLPNEKRQPGEVPVYGSNGVVGFHNEAISEGPGILVGRKGSIGEVHYCDGPFWAIDTTYFIDSRATTCNLKWLALQLKALDLRGLNKATGVPGLDRKDVYALEVQLPPNSVQVQQAESIEERLSLASLAYSVAKEQLETSHKIASSTLASTFAKLTPISTAAKQEQAFEGWRWHCLTDFARLESGHTPSRRHPEWWGGHVPWLALPDIRKLHGKYAYETTENTNDAGLANSSARLLPPGTVCLCRDASIGYVTILGKPMATSQHFSNWICGPELDPEFLMYAFMASHDYLRDLGSGSVIKTIYMSVIESFHICAPEIDEQRRIARTLRERLAAAESLTVGLKARLADIEHLPQRLLAAAFPQH